MLATRLTMAKNYDNPLPEIDRRPRRASRADSPQELEGKMKIVIAYTPATPPGVLSHTTPQRASNAS